MYLDITALKQWLRPLSLTTLAKDRNIMEKAKTLISYYYYVMPYVALLYVSSSILARENFDPHWPLAWVNTLGLDFPTIVLVVKIFFVTAAVLSVFLHKHWPVRFLVFIAIVQVHALESSFGSINHQWYLWLYTSLIFTFLPNIWQGKIVHTDAKRKFLLYIWSAQAIAMLTYTMAGMWKFYFAYQQFLVGEVHGLAMHAFAYQVANWLPRLQTDAILAPFVIAYPEISWPFYATLPFIQLFAIWTMIRPSLQKIWALLLVLFHIGTFLTMGISFHPLVILIIILFFNTPFAPEKVSAEQILRDFPLVGWIYKWILEKTYPLNKDLLRRLFTKQTGGQF